MYVIDLPLTARNIRNFITFYYASNFLLVSSNASSVS
jgi:hypothetical protein